MTRPLEGRAALITGASQGLGLAIAARLRRGRRQRDAVRPRRGAARRRPRERGRARGDRARWCWRVAADVSRPDQVGALVGRRAAARFRNCTILVNNAGVYGPMGPIEDVDWDAWVRAIEINLFGSILMCRALLPHFKAQRYGKIVQLSGGGATNPLPRHQRLRGVEGRDRALRRDAGARSARTTGSTSTPSRPAR